MFYVTFLIVGVTVNVYVQYLIDTKGVDTLFHMARWPWTLVGIYEPEGLRYKISTDFFARLAWNIISTSVLIGLIISAEGLIGGMIFLIANVVYEGLGKLIWYPRWIQEYEVAHVERPYRQAVEKAEKIVRRQARKANVVLSETELASMVEDIVNRDKFGHLNADAERKKREFMSQDFSSIRNKI